MGINAMFSDAADFSNIFDESPIGTRITQVQHKTFIDVNEIGCEAAGISCTCYPLNCFCISLADL